MRKRYLLLHRALKNSGDFLIGQRAHMLIKYLRPEVDITIGKGWVPLRDQFQEDFFDSINAIIIAGGPGYLPNMYPDIYPLVEQAANFKVPVFLMGLGVWMSSQAYKNKEPYIFNNKSNEFLSQLDKQGTTLGVRDALSYEVLEGSGFKNVQLNGCPVWYSKDFFGKSMKRYDSLRSIAFTPPAAIEYFDQAKTLLSLIVDHFPKAEVIVGFHRGYAEDRYTNSIFANTYSEFAQWSQLKGCKVKDLSYSAETFSEYDEIDVHIGYRVHAHLHFLSNRKVSALIAEDSRGIGVKPCLGTIIHKGWTPDGCGVDNNTPNMLMDEFSKEFSRKFSCYQDVPDRIDSRWNDFMKPYILELP